MQVGKGDIRSQRRRRRDRYRGCRVCGVRGVHCTECDTGAEVVAIHGCALLSLVVDGSFVVAARGGVDRDDDRGHGGAGLVLVHGDEIVTSRACGFRSVSSSDAELQAIIRGARWARGVAIYTDARDLPVLLTGVNPHLIVRYLDPRDRQGRYRSLANAYALAHRLSVEGRCREAPATISAGGIAFAAARATRSKAERRRAGADLLLEQARRDPSFDGDFTALASRLGWTSGRRWQDNPAIRIASARWSAGNDESGDAG